MVKFDDKYHLYDITPLENMFIQQYLVKSPGDYVKIYIYCLNMCYYPNGSKITYSTIASSLKLNEEDVRRAFRYWSRLGIITVSDAENGTLDIEMHSTTEMLFNNDSACNEELYRYRDFNDKLNDAFYPRLLDAQDLILYQDIMGIFNVKEDYVIEAVKYSIKTAKSTDIPYRYVEKVIDAWKSEGINDVEAIKTYLDKKETTYREISSILKYLGMNRQPTVPEVNCYKKWVNDFGFTFDAIKEACNQTLSANTPTIKYLDSILTELHSKDIDKPEKIVEITEKSENYRNKTRKLLFYLGIQKAPSAIQIQKYKKWEVDYGYDEEAITVATTLISTNGNQFDALDNILESFHMNGIKNADEILNYINNKCMFDNDIKQIQSVLGSVSDVTDAEREYLRVWKNELGLPTDLILYSAKIAITAEKPWRYMNSILSSWKKLGIVTVKQAEEFNSPYDNQQPSSVKVHKTSSFVSDVESHKYTDEDYRNMFDNFGDFKKND